MRDELILLGQAGYSQTAVREQVERLCSSNALKRCRLLKYLVEEALAGRIPKVADVAVVVAGPGSDSGQTNARTEKGRLAKELEAYYAQHHDEIYLVIPDGDYAVFARKRKSLPADGAPIASILEPADGTDAYARVTVRGVIEELDADLRLWLVVQVPDGSYYPQCRVSRRSSSWEHSVRVGRLQWRESEGFPFEILLVALDTDGDYDFDEYQKHYGDGFGMNLPRNAKILDTRQVIRRDHRPVKPPLPLAPE